MSSASHCGADALSTARSLSSSSSARASAVPCYWSALSTTPTAPVAYELASLAYSLGDTSSVERSLSLAVRVDPSFGEGYFELGNVYFDQRRHAEAAHTFRASLAARKPPRDLPMVHNNLANVLSEVGDREGAAREYEAGLRIAPTFPYLLNGAANLQAESGQLAEAASTLGTLLEAHPDAHYARHNRGIFLRGLKRWDEAESELRAALAAKPIALHFRGQIDARPEYEDRVSMCAATAGIGAAAANGFVEIVAMLLALHAPLEAADAEERKEERDKSKI